MAGAGSPRGLPVGWLAAFLVVGILSGAVSGAVVSLLVDSDGDGPTTGAPASVRERRVVVDESSAVSDAVAVALPAVVTVLNQQPERVNEAGQIVETVSIGTGVIVDANGYVVTNEHVVRDAETLSVVLIDGQERPAELVSHDAPFNDIAVLRIQGGGLSALPFGDSDSLVVGQRVAALGSAIFEYRAGVTEGVVSALHRRWLRDGIYMEDLVQTDAALNPGNSGGPLINTRSEVIGINTNVVRQLGTEDAVYGIAFAIASNRVAPIVAAIIENGAYPRPYLGVDHVDVDSALAAQLGLPIERGALVERVISDSPAAAAGIEAGDVIIGFDLIELGEEMPFINALARLEAEAAVEVRLLHDGELITLPVQLRPR